MKKFHYLLTAVCVLFMVGCSDNDDKEPTGPTGPTSLDKSYAFGDESVNTTGYVMPGSGGTIKLVSEDLVKGNITISNYFPGENDVVFPITLTENSSKPENYDFKGENNNDYRNITIEGTAGDGLDIKIDNKINGGIVGEFKPMFADFTGMTTPTINFKITPNDKDEIINMGGLLTYGELPLDNTKDDSFQKSIALISGTALNYVIQFRLNMQENGFLTASWKSLASPEQFPAGESKDGLVSYSVSNDKIFIKLPFEQLFAGLFTRADQSLITGFLNGIPLILDKADATGITAHVTKEMIAPVMPLLTLLKPTLAKLEINGEYAEAMGITGQNLANLIDELNRVINVCSEFTIEFNLQPASAEPVIE